MQTISLLGRLNWTRPFRAVRAGKLNRQAIDLDPLNAGSWESLAEIKAMMGQLDQSEADSKKALEVNPDHWSTSINLSRIYLLQGRPQDALVEIERVHNATYRAHLYALTYYALGRKKESDAALGELMSGWTELMLNVIPV